MGGRGCAWRSIPPSSIRHWRGEVRLSSAHLPATAAKTPTASTRPHADRFKSLQPLRARRTLARMTSPPAPQTIDRTAPRALWLAARAFLNVLHNLFGAPEAVAAAHVLTRPAHDLLRTWLRAGEAMLRHLLLIEASAFPKPNTPPLLRAARHRERKRLSFSPETPERWRVSFRCFQRPAAPHAKRQALRRTTRDRQHEPPPLHRPRRPPAAPAAQSRRTPQHPRPHARTPRPPPRSRMGAASSAAPLPLRLAVGRALRSAAARVQRSRGLRAPLSAAPSRHAASRARADASAARRARTDRCGFRRHHRARRAATMSGLR